VTVSSEIRKAGPYLGDGVVVQFPFDFKVFAPSDIEIVQADVNGNETTLTSGYTVALNTDQENNPGGAVTLDAPLGIGELLVIISRVPYLQPANITNQGGFYPNVLNAISDRSVILSQQLREEVERSVKVPVTSDIVPGDLVREIFQRATDAETAATQAEGSASVAQDSAATAQDAAATAQNAASGAAASVVATLQSYADSASNSAGASYNWANYPEDTEVPSVEHPGKFSAFHWEEKARQYYESTTTSDRGTYYNAYDASGSIVYEVSTAAIDSAGSGYSAGEVLKPVIDNAEYPAWLIVESVDESGAITAISDTSSTGIFSIQPADDTFATTSSGGGSGATLALTFAQGVASTTRDIVNPLPSQTCTVLHNENAGGAAWIFVYSDRNGDGVFNWIERNPIADAINNIPDDGVTITSASGVRTLTDAVKSKINGAFQGWQKINAWKLNQRQAFSYPRNTEVPCVSISFDKVRPESSLILDYALSTLSSGSGSAFVRINMNIDGITTVYNQMMYLSGGFQDQHVGKLVIGDTSDYIGTIDITLSIMYLGSSSTIAFILNPTTTDSSAIGSTESSVVVTEFVNTDSAEAGGAGSIAFVDITGAPTDNDALASALNAKQGALTAGQLIGVNRGATAFAADDGSIALPTGLALNSGGDALIAQETVSGGEQITIGNATLPAVLPSSTYLDSVAAVNAVVVEGGIAEMRDDVTQLQAQIAGQTNRYLFSFTDVGITAPPDGLTDYIETTYGVTVGAGYAAKNSDDNHLWVFYSSTGWNDDGLDTVAIATSTALGIVHGSTADGEVAVSNMGEMTVNGWGTLAASIAGVVTNRPEIILVPADGDVWAVAALNPGALIAEYVVVTP
jgi:hypothetical protein